MQQDGRILTVLLQTTAEASSSTTSSVLSTITGASGSASVSGASGTLTGTGLNASATSSSTGSAEPASSGLSSGAAAGIGAGVAIGAVALIGAGVFFWWRRRKAAKAAAAGGPDGPEDQMHQHHNGAAAGYSPGTAHASNIAPSPSPNTPYKDYYGNEAKVLGHMQPHAHAAEAGNTPIYEAPTEARYELDSGHGQPHQGYSQGPAQLDETTRR